MAMRVVTDAVTEEFVLWVKLRNNKCVLILIFFNMAPCILKDTVTEELFVLWVVKLVRNNKF